MPRCHQPPQPESCPTCRLYVDAPRDVQEALDRVPKRGQNKAPRDPWKTTVRVGIPPDVPTGSSPRAVVTVASGATGRDLLALSGPGLKAYARRCGADFVVLDWPGDPLYPITSKFALTKILDAYDRVAYFDADVLIPPCADNIFDAVPYDMLGAYNDLPDVIWRGHAVFAEEYEKFRSFIGLPRHPLPWYVNTGVMVFSRAHRDVFVLPSRSLPTVHCSEQHWWVSRMYETKTKVQLLDREWNWQWWGPGSLAGAPDHAILHYSGMQFDGGNPERLKQMAARLGPCVYRDDDLSAMHSKSLGLAPGKRWALCMADPKPNGMYVCPCTGCGPKCKSYESLNWSMT